MERFERLTLGIAHIQKTIQRIKHIYMNSLGMKGSHAICIACLRDHPEGLSAAELVKLTALDKAAVSRILRELEAGGYIRYEEQKRYRSRIFLTDRGQMIAAEVTERIEVSEEAGREQITDEEMEQFYRTLGKLTKNLDAFCDTLEKTEPTQEGVQQ